MGWRVAVDSEVRAVRPGVLIGGSPMRLLRLSPAGQAAFAELCRDGVTTHGTALLARRLLSAGIVHPRPAPVQEPVPVTVVIPVKDRIFELDRCLSALGSAHRVIVVDDGSEDQSAIAAVARRHGAELVRLASNRGPAAARNAGLALVETPLVAFLDSDCVADGRWIEELAAHLTDGAVGAVAPRITAAHANAHAGESMDSPVPARAWRGGYVRSGVVERFGRDRSPLDMGPLPGRIAPLSRIGYVPTAALIARAEVIRSLGGFDEELRVGEDVDLEWRLIEAGWELRYDPSSVVGHEVPRRWSELLGRHLRYGTAAAALERRHPGNVPPLVLAPWPTATVVALLARRPLVASVIAVCAGVDCSRRLHGAALAKNAALAKSTALANNAALPMRTAASITTRSIMQTWLGIGRWCSQLALPAVAVMAVWPGRSPAARPGRRVAAASLLLGPPLVEWWRTRPSLDPVRYSLGVLVDEAAYGTGVIIGCLRASMWWPIVPASTGRTQGRKARTSTATRTSTANRESETRHECSCRCRHHHSGTRAPS